MQSFPNWYTDIKSFPAWHHWALRCWSSWAVLIGKKFSGARKKMTGNCFPFSFHFKARFLQTGEETVSCQLVRHLALSTKIEKHLLDSFIFPVWVVRHRWHFPSLSAHDCIMTIFWWLREEKQKLSTKHKVSYCPCARRNAIQSGVRGGSHFWEGAHSLTALLTLPGNDCHPHHLLQYFQWPHIRPDIRGQRIDPQKVKNAPHIFRHT